MVISKIVITEEAVHYLVARRLDKQYRKAKAYILAGFYINADLKIREPKSDRIWYFRINKQFRAICELRWETLYVLAIDNHQNP